MSLLGHPHHHVPFAQPVELDGQVERERREHRLLEVRFNDLAATVRGYLHTIERLEHENAHLRYLLDTRPHRRWVERIAFDFYFKPRKGSL